MRALSHIKRQTVADYDEDLEGLDIQPHRPNGKEYGKAAHILPKLLLAKALPREIARRLRTGRPAAVIIVAPEDALPMLDGALRDMCSDALRTVHCQSRTNGDPLAALADVAAGAPVVCLTSSVAHVPELLRKLCADVMELPFVDLGTLRTVLRRCTRGRIPLDFAPDVSGLPLSVVCSAIVSGARAEHAISALNRLTASPASSDAYPRLQDCIEYGPLRDWGLQLGKDLEAWQAGHLAAADLDTSVLLVSPPGFGKTYFAGVLQKHLGVPLFHLRIGELMAGDGYLNTTLKNMTRAFESARQAAPSILFLDEIDVLQHRSEGSRNDAYFNAVVNHALVLLDGCGRQNTGVVIIGATNRAHVLDPALTRPGRLARTITVPLPDRAAREHILRTHLGNLLPDVPLTCFAERMEGATPAEIMQFVQEAKARARAQAVELTSDHLSAVLPDQLQLSLAQKWRIAIHEAGHATIGVLLDEPTMQLKSASIRRLADSGGHTSFEAAEGFHSTLSVEHRAMILLGGRAAEMTILGGEKTAGAGGSGTSDLAMATKTIAAAIGSFGLYDTIVWRGDPSMAGSFVQEDSEFKSLVEGKLRQLMRRAETMIAENANAVRAVAKHLVKRGSADAATIARIVGSASACSTPATTAELNEGANSHE